MTQNNEQVHNKIESLPNSGFTPLYSKINFRNSLRLQQHELSDKLQAIFDVLKDRKTPLRQRIYHRIMEELDLLSNYLLNIIPLGDETKVIDPSLLRECVDLVSADKPIASMLYHNDHLWAFNGDRHYGYKYQAMWFGAVPQWSLRERSIYSPTFPPELLCDKTLVHHNSIYCLSTHTRITDFKCLSDIEKKCNYTFSFSADQQTDLIEGLTYACSASCKIYLHEGKSVVEFIMKPELVNKLFGKTGSFNNILGVLYDFLLQHWWTIFVWLSFGGFNVIIVILTCFTNYFISNQGEFRWCPCSANDMKNLAKCCCCRKQNLRSSEYELVSIQRPTTQNVQ